MQLLRFAVPARWTSSAARLVLLPAPSASIRHVLATESEKDALLTSMRSRYGTLTKIVLVDDGRRAVLWIADTAAFGDSNWRLLLVDHQSGTVQWELRRQYPSRRLSVDAERGLVVLLFEHHVEAMPLDEPARCAMIAVCPHHRLQEAVFVQRKRPGSQPDDSTDDTLLLATTNDGVLFYNIRQRSVVGRHVPASFQNFALHRIKPLGGGFYALHDSSVALRRDCMHWAGSPATPDSARSWI